MNHSDIKMTVRLMFRLLPVQILLSAIGAINGMVTGLFASNFVGSTAMSAVGLYNPISMLVGAVSTVLISGSMILCGKYIGMNMPEKTQDIFSLDLFLSIAVSAVFIVFHLFTALFTNGSLLTDDPVLWKVFQPYLIGQAVGVIPMILGNHLASFLSLENRMQRTTIASLIYIAVNIVLNYIFLAVMRLEAFGLALSASLGMWIFFAVEAQHFFRKDAVMKFRLSLNGWRESLSVVLIGLPGAMTSLYMTVRGFIVNGLILSHVGNAGLSAFTASNSLLGLFWAIPAGMLAVVRMLISISVGEEDRQSLRDIMRAALFRYVSLMCAVSAFIILMAVPFTRLYFRDPSDPVYMMTVWGFRILPLCMPLSTICMFFSCYWQTSGRPFPVHLLAFLDGLVSVAAFTALLIGQFGMNSVYVANVLNGAVTTLVIFLYACIKNRHIPKNMEQLMVIPEKFGAAPEDRLDLSVRDIQDVINISEEIQEFCQNRGLDERRSYIAALALEEMAGNVVLHGFTKDTRPHSADIRVVYKDDSAILRIKDDCIPFDPAERLSLIDPDDLTKNIGIRMIYKLAGEISYQNILGLNVLSVKI